jgi:hypothetical protein
MLSGRAPFMVVERASAVEAYRATVYPYLPYVKKVTGPLSIARLPRRLPVRELR